MVRPNEISEELLLISLATVPEVIGFCSMGCAENWKKEIPAKQ
jgi:hypothetical protein